MIQNSLKNNYRPKIKDIKEDAQKKWNVGVNKTKAIKVNDGAKIKSMRGSNIKINKNSDN